MSAAVENIFCNDYQTFAVDDLITYPSYKSFDSFIDVDRLRSMDAELSRIIRSHIEAEKGDLFRNLYRLESDTPYEPGVREVWLSRTAADAPWEYLDMVDSVDLWEPSEAADEFPDLMEFIGKLPFKSTGRMLIIYDDLGKAVPAHRDHLQPDVCNEFIWFRTNLAKPFYMLNNETGDKKYVTSYSCWFDAVNQYHGTDACDELSFSIRVDGIFTDEFRQLIPTPAYNPASTPAYWAAVEASTL